MATSEGRRGFLSKLGGGVSALTVADTVWQINPTQARAKGEALRKLSTEEGRTLEALGDALLPGAAEAGIAYYVDSQLASPTPLLMLKYLDYSEPYLDFYRQGLASLGNLALSRHGGGFPALAPQQQSDLLREISQRTPAEWRGPPAPLFFFVVRNDAVDVYYGTQEGFARLDVPYMPHIVPPANW